MGVPQEEIDAAKGDNENGKDEGFVVWPENGRALDAFFLVRRQWRVDPMGGVIGLYWPGVKSLLRMSKIKIDADLLADLDAIEGGVIEVWNAKPSPQGGPR